jgi:hypothetical protein
MRAPQCGLVAVVGVFALIGCQLASVPPATPTVTLAAATASAAATVTPSPTSSATPTTTPRVEPSPSVTPSASAAVEPAAPADIAVAYAYQDHSDGSTTITTTVTWTADIAATTVEVFGVNKCLTVVQGAKCASDGMTIPSADLLSLASASADRGTVSWKYWAPEGATYYCGAIGVVADRGQIADPDHWYYAIVVQAESEAGNSPFAVATTTTNEDVTC